MKIKKTKDTGNKKYPKKVTMSNRIVLRIPQQRQFGAFALAHGCSLAAIDIALQVIGMKKNPDEVYTWCKNHLPGYTGSKVTIMGCKRAINQISGKNQAKYMVITGTKKNRKKAIRKIKECLRQDGIVLVESDNPIHTDVLIAKRKGGVWDATNGTLKKTTIPKMVKGAIKRKTSKARQTNWYSGRDGDCGIVLLYPGKEG